MTWVHVAGNGGMGVEEQELLRWHGKPVCALKQSSDGWRASLLNLDGYGARTVLISNEPLDMAKIRCEQHLMLMGWKRPEGAHPQPFNKSDRGRQRREERRLVLLAKTRGIAHVDP
jgi:hypothetical protein